MVRRHWRESICVLGVLLLLTTVACTSSDDSGDEALRSCVARAIGKGVGEPAAEEFCEAATKGADSGSSAATDDSSSADEPPSQAESSSQDEPDSNVDDTEPAPDVLPDVVGMDLQEAQDTLQAAGYRHLESIDDTGRGRHQIIDSNWVVVSMLPDAGEEVSTAYEITLFVVKDGEQ